MIHFRGAGILLDIEGTTSSIEFVHDVLFPFARQHLAEFLVNHWSNPIMTEACARIMRDAGVVDWPASQSAANAQARVMAEVHRLMDADAKTTGLKALQGLIWDGGYRAGALQSHLFDDVVPALRLWRQRGIDIRVFSSGSVAAQKAYFSHTPWGDLLPYFGGHYDTTTGPKKDAVSYQLVAKDMGLAPDQILFLSDIPAELDAAQSAGFRTGLATRPGNVPVDETCRHPRLTSFADVIV